MLSQKVLLPINSKIPDPLTSMFEEFEEKAKTETLWLNTFWPQIKKALVLRCLQKPNGLFFVKGLRAPSELIQDAILEMFEAVSGSAYFSIHFPKAFSYWLEKGQLCSKYSQFQEKEVQTIFNILTNDEIEDFRKTKKETKEFFGEKISFKFFFETLQRSIHFLSNKHLKLLEKKDPAIFSQNDLHQQLNLQVFLSLKNCDKMTRNEIGWAVTIAKNALHIVTNRANIRSIKTEPLDDNLEEKLLSVISSLEAEEKCFFDSLMRRAEPRIQMYLRFLFGDENPEFWEWFAATEPELSKKEIYKQPEVVLPWVQRWLNLGTWEVVSFFKEHYPELTSNPRKRA